MSDPSLSGLRAYLSEHPDAVIETVAREWRVTAQAVLEALPAGLARFAPGAVFAEVMGDIAQWGDATLIIHSEDGIFEFTGPVPPGEIGRGSFNLTGVHGLHGHIRHDRCRRIAFVERVFMGKPSAFVAFINSEGGIMFKVFVGRDEKRALRADPLLRFRHLISRTAEENDTIALPPIAP